MLTDPTGINQLKLKDILKTNKKHTFHEWNFIWICMSQLKRHNQYMQHFLKWTFVTTS